MIVEAKILSVSDIRSGVSAKGRPWTSCDFVIEFGEEKTERLVLSAWDEQVTFIKEYDINARAAVKFDLCCYVRDSYRFDARKYNEISVQSMEYVTSQQ